MNVHHESKTQQQYNKKKERNRKDLGYSQELEFFIISIEELMAKPGGGGTRL